MSKQKIGAREVVTDLKSGMSDAELMAKYDLSPKGLESLFGKLVQAKILDESYLRKRAAAAGRQRAPESAQSPAPASEPKPAETEPPSELAQAVLQDIKDGRHDNEIMRNHELSPGQLKQIRADLVQSGLLVEATAGPSKPVETRLCPTCSQEVEASATECPSCGRWLEPESSTGPGATTPPHPPAGVVSREELVSDEIEEDKECPWENRENYGTLNAYFQTATKLILTPTSFFARLPTSGSYLNPILFAAMSVPIGVVLSYLWMGLFKGTGFGGLIGLLIAMSCAFVAALITVPIGLAIWSGLLHLCLYLMGAAREGFEATFRVVSYSTVTSIFNAIPVVGTLASLWSLVLNVIGLRETHKTTTGKAIAAVAIPVGIGLVIVLISVAAGLASLAKLGLSTTSVPEQACQAVEAYIIRVDGAAGLDAGALETEVKEAMRELGNDLKPYKDRPGVLALMQKAAMFGIAAVQQAKTGQQFGKGIDELRDDLRNTCR